MKQPDSKQDVTRLATILAIVVVGMFGFSFALVPLYNVFCEITGINGKSTNLVNQSVVTEQQETQDRVIRVEFVAISNSKLPWEFRPSQRSMDVHPGKMMETTYFAKNWSDHSVTAQAVPSVAPGLAAKHFTKIECFCFTRQTLKAGEEKAMPVRFMVSPDLDESVKNIVLSYTFFEQGGDERHPVQDEKTMPHNRTTNSSESPVELKHG